MQKFKVRHVRLCVRVRDEWERLDLVDHTYKNTYYGIHAWENWGFIMHHVFLYWYDWRAFTTVIQFYRCRFYCFSFSLAITCKLWTLADYFYNTCIECGYITVKHFTYNMFWCSSDEVLIIIRSNETGNNSVIIFN